MATAEGSPSGIRIAAASALVGVPIPTIRSWERRYGFPAPPRTGGQHRRYTTHDLAQLRALRDAITRGLSAHEAVEVVRRASAADAPRGRHVKAVVDAAMAFDPTRLRAVLDGAVETMGVEIAITEVALPAMADMGSRWKAGVCEVGNEHIATEGVRAWLARLGAMAPAAWRDPIVLGCGPSDLHSIGLEAFAVLLARRGWSCRTLGPRTPTETFLTAVRSVGAVAAVVVAHRTATRRGAQQTIARLDVLDGVTVFFAGGAFSAASSRKTTPGVYLDEDLVAATGVVEDVLAREARGSMIGAG